MNLPSILLWGFVATIVMSTIMEGSRGIGWSRMSLPFMLGTLFTPNYDRAATIGFVAQFVIGWLLALLYALVFESWHRATWWLGGGIGIVHGTAFLVLIMPLLPSVHPRMATERDGPDPTRALEPPGFLALNYGNRTPLFTMLGHIAYGMILGGFYRMAS
jgi:uncharacterized membrane protein YagU involved in acid resistance